MKIRHCDGNSCCNFVTILDIVAECLADGLPTLENLIIDTNIMKIGQVFTEYDQKGCPVAAILDLAEAYVFPRMLPLILLNN